MTDSSLPSHKCEICRRPSRFLAKCGRCGTNFCPTCGLISRKTGLTCLTCVVDSEPGEKASLARKYKIQRAAHKLQGPAACTVGALLLFLAGFSLGDAGSGAVAWALAAVGVTLLSAWLALELFVNWWVPRVARRGDREHEPTPGAGEVGQAVTLQFGGGEGEGAELAAAEEVAGPSELDGGGGSGGPSGERRGRERTGGGIVPPVPPAELVGEEDFGKARVKTTSRREDAIAKYLSQTSQEALEARLSAMEETNLDVEALLQDGALAARSGDLSGARQKLQAAKLLAEGSSNTALLGVITDLLAELDAEVPGAVERRELGARSPGEEN
ncbi:MAG: hypothetical protein Kow0069_07120 [Promethearchaeota archaeon]